MAVLQALPGESIPDYVERFNRSGSGWTPDPALIPLAGTVAPAALTTRITGEPSPALYDPLAVVPSPVTDVVPFSVFPPPVTGAVPFSVFPPPVTGAVPFSVFPSAQPAPAAPSPPLFQMGLSPSQWVILGLVAVLVIGALTAKR